MTFVNQLNEPGQRFQTSAHAAALILAGRGKPCAASHSACVQASRQSFMISVQQSPSQWCSNSVAWTERTGNKRSNDALVHVTPGLHALS